MHDLTSMGKALYDGTHEVYATAAKQQQSKAMRIRDARDASVALPAEQAACVSCHRPSGLGSFEGGVAVPPISGHLLFNAYDTATTRRYNFPNVLRVRPAYSEASLRKLLATGTTPDGRQLSPLMPRYDFTEQEVHALAEHLKQLSAERAPGVSNDTVYFATITTDDVSKEDVSDVMNTLNTFFVTKNAGTRGEFGRRAQAERKEQSMYLRHRNWQLLHWQLKGAPETWAEQLAALWQQQPVFAVLSGISGQRWQPVHDFCARTATPCLLPMADMPPEQEDFYSIYFSRGLAAQAQQALQHLQSQSASTAHKQVMLLTAEGAVGQQQRQLLEKVIAQQGFELLNKVDAKNSLHAVISTMTQAQSAERLAALNVSTKNLILLGGAYNKPINTSTKKIIDSTVSDNSELWFATDYPYSNAASQALSNRALTRANVWLRGRNLKVNNPLIASNALFAATLATESLMHVDERFSREYCVEKLEHNLEVMPPLTGHLRLSIGPKQRFASKRVHMLAAQATPDGVVSKSNASAKP